ncbi:MAG: hypothetical protein GF313_05830 [Caldithrix sp.]|nr:hypothetical protein [Caldithrix sp.]
MNNHIPSASAEEAKKLWESDTVFIDVREREENEQARIPQSTLLPLSEINQRFEEIPKDRQVVMYCRTGNRSGYLIEILQANGYNNLINLDGGIVAWYEQNYPVQSGPAENPVDVAVSGR